MQAEARIRQARAARGIAASGLGPTVDATGAIQRSRSPGRSSGWQDGVTRGLVSNTYDAGFDAGWELDIFGGIRRNIEAADADLLASVESRRDVLVTLTAEVARNYIELRAFQQRIEIAQENLDTPDTHRPPDPPAVRRRVCERPGCGQCQCPGGDHLLPDPPARGRGPAVHLRPQHPAGPGAGRPGSGAGPGFRHPGRSSRGAPVGVPSDLLRRRPDIRRAEAEIHAATARIGVATADLFPKFTITGSAGLRSGDFSSWLTWAQRFWSFGPSASWRLFDTGRTQSAIEQQEALQEQALIAYRQTVLAALQEVENALIASAKEQERRESLVSAVAANRKAVSLAKTLYTEGQTDFLSVLDAQRSLFLTEETLVLSTSAVSTDLVALYKAIGSGWNADMAEAGAPRQNNKDLS